MEATCENLVLNSFDGHKFPVTPHENGSSLMMDFFSTATANSHINPLTLDHVKQEHQELQLNLHVGSSPTTTEIRTGCNVGSLLTDNKSAHKLAILQAELKNMRRENEALRSMVTQVKEKYICLQRHIEENTPIETSNGIKTDSRVDSPDNLDDTKFDSSKDGDRGAVEASMRRVRVAVRAQSEASMISDGCQWRKYGQKMAKGNPCPRAYYRCTMGVGCPVRKQLSKYVRDGECLIELTGVIRFKSSVCKVQRCAEDRTVLVTTYEGVHNHPLPQAAMAMASTTSTAASMLLSGSKSSSDHLTHHLTRSIQSSYPPNLTTTLSATAPFPTITLDLTNPARSDYPIRQPPFNFPFSTNMHPNNINFPNRPHVLGLGQQNNIVTKFADVQSSSGGDREMINAAAVTSDPSFMAALVAAIGSIIGSDNRNNAGDDIGDNKNDDNFKRC